MIDVRDVRRRFRNARGVGPVDLRIESGERVVLMGPNGAGKTTLLRLLATVDRASQGEILWDGNASRTAARRFVGVAPDRAVEESALTGRQATHFWCSQWVGGQRAASLVEEALEIFGLLGVADEPVATYSFGMSRRLALTQALAHQPRLALLDEPTAGLDPEGVRALHDFIVTRARNGWVTVVASNDCGFAGAACDRVVFLHEGHVVRDASPATLLGELAPVRRAELKVFGDPDLAALAAIPGVGGVERHNGSISIELLTDTALGSVVAVADAPGGRMRALTLHTPDLSDCFRSLTGHELIELPR